MKQGTIQEKAKRGVRSAAVLAARVSTGLSLAAAGLPATGIFAANGDELTQWLNNDDNKVNVDTGKLEGTSVMSRFLQIISWITRLFGIFVVGKSVLDFLQAKQDENAVNEGKAVRQAAIGIAMILAPSLLQVIFGAA